MKKFNIVVISMLAVCLILSITSINLAASKPSGNNSGYNDLINAVIEYQSKSSELFEDYILVSGEYRSQTSTKDRQPAEDINVRLDALIVTNNALVDDYKNRFFYFFEISLIKSKDNKILWSK